jgi:hypothetical protein
LVFGAFLTWTAFYNWRHRHESKVSIVETIILKAADEDPLPLTRLDSVFKVLNILMAVIFGPILLVFGAAMLIQQLSIAI